jgi:hypothetical protein
MTATTTDTAPVERRRLYAYICGSGIEQPEWAEVRTRDGRILRARLLYIAAKGIDGWGPEDFNVSTPDDLYMQRRNPGRPHDGPDYDSLVPIDLQRVHDESPGCLMGCLGEWQFFAVPKGPHGRYEDGSIRVGAAFEVGFTIRGG